MTPGISEHLYAAFLMTSLTLLCIFVYLFVYLVRLKEKTIHLAGALLVGIYECILFSFSSKPSFAIAAVSIVVFAALDLFLFIRISRKKRYTITPMSIKEAVDQLPTGVCLYYPSGLPRLVNKKMTEICAEITGETLLSGQLFWEALIKNRVMDSESDVEKGGILVKAGSGKAYSVHRNELSFAEGMLYELTVSDVTEEYELSTELREKQEQAEVINRRLRSLGDKITEITREKEILDSKIRLHDEWGRALLLLRKRILNPEETDLSEVFRTFERNIAVFESESDLAGEEHEQSRDDIVEAADALGISIEFTGEIPEDPERGRLINIALITCVSNLSQHAQGHLLSVNGTKLDDKYRLLFTNDGKVPEGIIKEAGGLKNLRNSIESAGGKMWIESIPRFELWIELGGKQDGN